MQSKWNQKDNDHEQQLKMLFLLKLIYHVIQLSSFSAGVDVFAIKSFYPNSRNAKLHVKEITNLVTSVKTRKTPKMNKE